MAAFTARLRVAPFRSRHAGPTVPSGRSRSGSPTRREGPLRHGERRWVTLGGADPGQPAGTPRAECCPADRRRSRSQADLRSTPTCVVVSCRVPIPLPAPRGPVVRSVCPRVFHRGTRHGRSSVCGVPCACRYESHLVGHIIPGQGLFSNSQGYPRNFPFTHSCGALLHRKPTATCTARICSPVDSAVGAGLNGGCERRFQRHLAGPCPRWSRGDDHHHSVVHVAHPLHARRRPAGRLSSFFEPQHRTGEHRDRTIHHQPRHPCPRHPC